MEYYKTDDGQIQADLARRLGIVLKQYHTQINSPEKYEVSLCLSILQTLLTHCVELLNSLKKSDRRNNPICQFPIDCDKWGFDENNVAFNSYYQPNLTTENVIRHVRNALCHPTKIQAESKAKTTGYITVGNTSVIEKVKFISSPDLNGKGNSKTYISREEAEEKIKMDGNFPTNVEVYEMAQGRFAFSQNGKPFHRIFEIELSPANLLTLTYSISNYLSHPLLETWDGKTFNIEKLVA